MKAEIKGKKLIIEIDLNKKESKTGKSFIIATTGGNKPAGLEYEGKPVIIGLNAYITKD